MGSSSMTTIGMVGAVVLILGGCGTESDDDQARAAQPLAFATPAALYSWAADTASDLKLTGVSVTRDATGEISSITLAPESREPLMRALHGDAGYFTVAGQRVDLLTSPAAQQPAAPSQDGVTQVTSALSSSSSDCSPGWCATGSSHNDHYTLFGVGYHSVGASTAVTPASAIYTSYAALANGYRPCATYECRTCVCVTGYHCNAGDQLVPYHISGRMAVPDTCFHSYGFVAGTATFFSVVNGQAVSAGQIFGRNEYLNSAGGELTAFGSKLIWGDYPEAGISGVCGAHFASGNGGSAMPPTTAAGNTSYCF